VAVTQKKMTVVPTAPTSLTTYYTVPADTSAIVKNIVISNPTTSPIVVTILVAGASLVFPVNNGTFSGDVSLVMNAGDTIGLSCSISGTVSVYISGVEVI
jgi:hypothetical protein